MKKVLIISGSKSDEVFVKQAIGLFEEWKIDYEYIVLSAHRNLKELMNFVENLQKDEYYAIIAVAGLSAALPGIVASLTDLPVIGVPIDVGPLNGVDALLSMVQMPSGVPVATMGIGNTGVRNAAYFVKRLIEMDGEK
ncbi:MAG TPA: 5-(carboxyamino)imidazole ribonucleotide mutase [Defluviitoga sp.]|nr:5-(carboxyamino)imidazole ribonucleotide mutase [Defluviitoga sp.]HOP23967.1 5-(carboxyamino)imidazole ribonucleotide mutase [Defluviitoga sp.]HPZ28902.1 5-(carboxyamino)imidazole ribonucleotide mutase [Defluviitoga sp.]HQD62288.1 5-(carboxyamino)imidazole ribonucleotide mutase [Defluviitoga sp.]